MLDEYQVAINHLAASVPIQVKEEAQAMHDALLADENADEPRILEAIVKTGMAEYPHRHAFEELNQDRELRKRLELVLEHVDESVRTKLKKHLDAGVSLEDIIGSDLFQTDFSGEERYQVEDAILDAKDHVKDELASGFDATAPDYVAAMKKWERHRDVITQKIEELLQLSEKDPKWKDEIVGKVKRFREGFSVTERDVELEEVEKEIEYWQGVLGEEI